MISDDDVTRRQRAVRVVGIIAAVIALCLVWRGPISSLRLPDFLSGADTARHVSADNLYVQAINNGSVTPVDRARGTTLVEISHQTCEDAAATVQQNNRGSATAVPPDRHERWLDECLAWVDAGAPVSG